MKSFDLIMSSLKAQRIDFKLSPDSQSLSNYSDPAIYEVTQDEIKNTRLERVLRYFNSLEKKKKNPHSIVIKFEGLSFNEKIYDMPDVRKWLQRLHKNKPYFFYYLDAPSEHYLHNILSCLVQKAPSFVPAGLKRYASGQSDLLNSGANPVPIIESAFRSLMTHALKKKHTPEEIIQLLSHFLLKTYYDSHMDAQLKPIE